MRSLLVLLGTLIILCVSLGACTETCNDNRNALPRAGFYALDSAGVLQSIQVDSLEVIGVGATGDSILSQATTSKSELYLPFKIESDTTQYLFLYRADGYELRDTVTFDYTRVARFVSAECGVSYVFHIHRINCQGNLIDSVVCPSGFIDNSAIENLKIYFRTR